MGKLNKKVKHKIKMDLKIGMLAMVVGIVIMMISFTSAEVYKSNSVCKHTPSGLTASGQYVYSYDYYSFSDCEIEDINEDHIWNWHAWNSKGYDRSGTFYDARYGLYGYAYDSHSDETGGSCTDSSTVNGGEYIASHAGYGEICDYRWCGVLYC